MAKYKTIIFDFFGVICSEVAPTWFNRYFSQEKTAILKDKYFKPFDLGKKSEEELYAELGNLINKSAPEIKLEFDELTNTIDEQLLKHIEKLKTTYKVGLLSNGGSAFVRSILKLYNIEKLFDNISISAEVGLVKPDPKIFELALRNMNSQAQNTIFIDDNQKNITGAKNIGLKTILYKNYNQFKKELNKILK